MVAMYGRGAKRAKTSVTMHGKTQVVGKTQDIFLDQRSEPPLVAANDNREWFAIITNINCEQKAQDGLKRLGIESYRPVYTKWQKHRQGRQEVERSLYSRYMFVAFPQGEPNWFGLRQTDGIESVVCNKGEPIKIPPAIIARIAHEQRTGMWDEVRRKVDLPYSVGETISFGPWGGHAATIEAITDTNVKLLMNMLGASRSVTVPAQSLVATGG